MADPRKDPQGTPLTADPTATSGDRRDKATGGEDSSPLENVPSGEAAEAAKEPQNAPVPRPRVSP